MPLWDLPKITQQMNDKAIAGVSAKSRQSCPTLGDPMNCSPPDSSGHEILQASILEWIATTFLQRIFLTQGLKPNLMSLALEGEFFTTSATWEAQKYYSI